MIKPLHKKVLLIPLLTKGLVFLVDDEVEGHCNADTQYCCCLTG